MSTRDSSRLRLALSALAAVGAMYVLVLVGMQAFARKAESSGVVYPYRHEDWLRYLLPSLWPVDGPPLLLIAGPSTARENLLVEEFAAANPGHRVFQGGLSVGTLTDVMASLEYVERVHGANALPRTMVLGISPRFLAEVPDTRPFAIGLDRYSRWYRVPDGEQSGFGLEPKPVVRGLMDHVRFLTLKQTPRYRAAFAWLLSRVVGPGTSESLSDTPPFSTAMRSGPGRLLFSDRLVELGVHDYAMERVSPYKYLAPTHIEASGLEDWLDEPDSFWAEAERWDPSSDSLAVRERVLALIDFARNHRIDTYVVNLPERSIGRIRQPPGFDARFHRYIAAAFDPLPVLDLRCFLSDAEFRDVEHALPKGSRRISRRVIQFIEEVARERSAGLGAPVTDESGVGQEWSDSLCAGGRPGAG